MPQAVLKPVMEAARSGRHPSATIDYLAAQVLSMHSLYMEMDAAQGLAEAARNALAAKNDLGEEHGQLCRAVNRIERIGAAAYVRARKFQGLLYDLEPRTLDEVLSLALAIVAKVDDFRDGVIEADEAEWTALSRAMGALVRGLTGAGATSPLLDLLAAKQDLVPWEDERALAEADAKRFLAEAAP